MNHQATAASIEAGHETEDSMHTAGKPVNTEVLIIGGGPAGSTAAALLAEQGFHVTLLEKCEHPRFHIGESLLPANMPLLDKLGVREQVAAIGMPKWGVEFNALENGKQTHIEFAEAWDKTMPYAYQVRRSEFDEVLFRNAQKKGAHGIEGCRVREVKFDDDHAYVKAQLADGSLQDYIADFVVDAEEPSSAMVNATGFRALNPMPLQRINSNVEGENLFEFYLFFVCLLS